MMFDWGARAGKKITDALSIGFEEVKCSVRASPAGAESGLVQELTGELLTSRRLIVCTVAKLYG